MKSKVLSLSKIGLYIVGFIPLFFYLISYIPFNSESRFIVYLILLPLQFYRFTIGVFVPYISPAITLVVWLLITIIPAFYFDKAIKSGTQISKTLKTSAFFYLLSVLGAVLTVVATILPCTFGPSDGLCFILGVPVGLVTLLGFAVATILFIVGLFFQRKLSYTIS